MAPSSHPITVTPPVQRKLLSPRRVSKVQKFNLMAGPLTSVTGLSLNQPLWSREKDKPHSLRTEKRAVLQKKISALLPRKRKLIPRKAKITNVFDNPSLPSY